jgi:signal transduction histidine kinase/CheY-like chemotaxis protein
MCAGSAPTRDERQPNNVRHASDERQPNDVRQSNNGDASREAAPARKGARRESARGNRARSAHGNQAMEEAARLKGQFLASLNHEIRTPLSGIVGMVDLLLETSLDDEQREFVLTTKLCADNLLEMLNATLEYSALSAGAVTPDQCEFHLAETIDSALSEHALRASSKGLALRRTLAGGLPETVLGDAPLLRKLLSHLIGNAVKFTERGEIEVSCACEGDRLVLRVSDTGIGIAAEHLPQVFESFHQVDGGLDRSYPGLGLGLSIVKQLVHLLQGSVQVDSLPQQGSVFSVRLPLRLPAQVIETPTATRHPQQARILVVEDNRVSRTVVRHMLTTRGYAVDCADCGADALQQVARTGYAVILMDLQLPDMTGVECTHAIRTVPGYAATPILAFTANTGEEFRALCRREGMQGFLAKPVQATDLYAALHRHLHAVA